MKLRNRQKRKSRFEIVKEIEDIIKLKRRKHHPMIHQVHYTHRISRKTIFYMKEYGPKSHVSSVIIRESIKVLILASIISSVGGVRIHSIQDSLLAIIPLLILLPALNNMIGSFGAIVSSKFTVLLYAGKADRLWKSSEVHTLFTTIMIIALISSVFLGILGYGLAILRGFAFDAAIFLKVLWIAMISSLILVAIIFFVSAITGLYIYSKQEDPSNFLIPIATSFSDLGSMVLFSVLVAVMF